MRIVLGAFLASLFFIPSCGPILVGQESAADSSWPTVRGAQMNGIATGNEIADHWPAEGPPVLWTRELGQGYSSFIAWDQSVATQYQNLGGQYVVCLNADSGATKWQYRYGWPYDPAGVYPGPRSTPTFDNGFVYFTSPSGLVGCLNAKSGELIWSIKLEQMFGISMPGFGYSCSPIVVDDKIVLPVGSPNASFVALNKRDGTVRWKSIDLKTAEAPRGRNTHESAASYCSVYPISFRGRECIVGYLQNSLVCLDSDTGESLWRHGLSSGYDEHSAWPIYHEPHLWITGAFQRGSELLEIAGETNPSVRTIRQSKLMSNDIFSSVLYDGALFGFDLHEAQAKTHRTSRGIFRCIDFRTGEDLWSVGSGRIQRSSVSPTGDTGITADSDRGESRVGHAMVLVADGKLILMNDLGELIVAEASRKGYRELCRASVLGGEICWTQPAIARSRLFVRNQSRSACVYLGPLETLSIVLREQSITVNQVPQNKFRDIASLLLGVEPEYLFDLPSLAWLWRWYWVSLVGIMGIAFAVAQLVSIVAKLWIGRRGLSEPTAIPPWLSLADCTFWVIAFTLGGLGTTLLSLWTQEFIFTWHVCLYVAWHAAIIHVSKRAESRTGWQRLQSIGAASLFLGSCLIYFLLCRRLSLVFEWVFLAGFLAALPFNLCAKHWFSGVRWGIGWRFAMACLGFSAYYWSSAAILIFRDDAFR